LKNVAIWGKLSEEEFDPKGFLQSFFPSNVVNIKKSLKLPGTLSFKSVEAFSEFINPAIKRIRSGNLKLDAEMKISIKSFQELFNHLKIPLKGNDGLSLNIYLESSSVSKEMPKL